MLHLQWEGSNVSFFYDIRSLRRLYPPGYFKFSKPLVKSEPEETAKDDSSAIDATTEQEGAEEKADDVKDVTQVTFALEPPASVSIGEGEIKSITNRYDKYACIHLDYRKPLSLYTLGGCKSSLFKKGMVLEVSLSHDPTKHWFAKIVKNVAGRLLLRWCLPSKAESQVEEKAGDVSMDSKELSLKDEAATAKDDDNSGEGLNDNCKESQSQRDDSPNVTNDDGDDEESKGDFWLFYCHPRVFKVGDVASTACQSEQNISYEPPIELENWQEFSQQFMPSSEKGESDVNSCVLTKDESTLVNYMLSKAKQLRPELLEDWSKLQVNDTVLIFPSNLLKLIPVQVDSKIPKLGIRFKSTPANSTAIDFWYPFDDGSCVLPHSWAEENEIPIDVNCVSTSINKDVESVESPAINKGDQIIDLDSWVTSSKSKIGTIRLKNNWDRINEFDSNGKVEIVHPDDASLICEGIIIRVTPPLVWIQISSERIRILPFNSTEMFPSGWCENNGYTLTRLLPSNGDSIGKLVEGEPVDQLVNEVFEGPKEDSNQDTSEANISESTTKAWCPRIYFNYKCFTGPSLSKSKLCNLPRFVGPGPVLLVMQEVISKILSIAYVSSRILNDLASDTFKELLKAKKISKVEFIHFKAKANNSSSKTVRLEIPVIRTTDKVEEYCHLICSHLKCCFNLFGPKLYDGDNCPSNCRGLTKSNKVLKKTDFFRQQAAAAKLVAEATADGDEITVPKFVVNLPVNTNKKANTKTAKRSIDEADEPPTNSKKKGKTAKKQKVSQLIASSKKDVQEEEDGDEEEAKSTTSSKTGAVDDGLLPEPSNDLKGQDATAVEEKDQEDVEADEGMDAEPVDKENEDKETTRKAQLVQKSKGFQPSRKLLPHENPINWSIARVYKFLCDSNCSVFAPTFRDHVRTPCLNYMP